MDNQTLVKSENALDVKKVISRQLDALRSARGLRTVKELAEEVGVPYESFNKYANGQAEPKAAFFAAMYQFGINLDWLIAGEGEMYRANRPDQLQYQFRDVTKKVSGVQEVAGDTGGTDQRICRWAKHYVATHSAEDARHLEERMRRAFPEFEGFVGLG